MQTLQTLYVQNPVWVWLAVGAIFVGLEIALGSGKLIWGGVAAAALAAINLAGIRLGSMIELGVFAVAAGILAVIPWRPRASTGRPARAKPVGRPKALAMGAGDERRTARLIGRIGRTTSEFANGVGRVWIDDAEWGAELDGEDSLPFDTPVRIMGVTGGVRLHVRNLTSRG